MTAGKIPKWEAELWSYLKNGDGIHCPVADYCKLRRPDGRCLSKNFDCISRLLNNQRFDFSKCTSRVSGEPGRPFYLVEMLAEKYLKRAGVNHPPVPGEIISRFDEQHPVEVRLLPLKACHGAVWRVKDGWVIQLRDRDAPGTRRLTIFHEAFHILARCRTTPALRQIGKSQGCFNELLADYFAVCILMPGEWVKQKWAEVGDPDEMARIFDTPRSIMRGRLKFLGLIQ